MPAPTAYAPSQTAAYPALFLHPLNESFIPKQIALTGGQRVKIGRQTNQKTAPAERNGYFDSKVLSRQHAEVWEEGNRIFIKDVKSSNGTFINGERLSQEGVESEQFELKTDDIVEFGIDIVGEDNKTIVHHRVAARIVCVFNADDAVSAAREAHNYQQQQHQHQQHQPPQSAAGTLSAGAQRRPLQTQSTMPAGMGGLGSTGRQAPRTGGLSFDHILQRLQGELIKTRETGAELGAVANAIGEIGDVMAGGQPPNLPSYPQQLPPVKAPSMNLQKDNDPAISQIQGQLAETQAKTDNLFEKLHWIETLLNEHDLRNLSEQVTALAEMMREQHHSPQSGQEQHHNDDDGDNSSIHTITPHELESVPEEDESEAEETDEERNARREELGRPRTPEPSSMGMRHDYDDRGMIDSSRIRGIPPELTQRLTRLSDQLEECVEMSQSLQSRHAGVLQTVEDLETKVRQMEELMRTEQAAKAEIVAPNMDEYAKKSDIEELLARSREDEERSAKAMLAEFEKLLERRLSEQNEERRVSMEQLDVSFKERVKTLGGVVEFALGKFSHDMTKFTSQFASENVHRGNSFMSMGKTRRPNGLATPPSPSSLSDSELYSSDLYKMPNRTDVQATADRRRTRSASPRRGRRKSSRSRSPATSTTSTTLVDSMSINGGNGAKPDPLSGVAMHSRSSSSDEYAPYGHSHRSDSVLMSESPVRSKFASKFPPTPSDSMHLEDVPGGRREAAKAEAAKHQVQVVSNTQFAVGVFVLGVAAAAVLWRVKE